MSLPYRLTTIGWTYQITLSHASGIQYGDTHGSVNLQNRVLAKQQMITRFQGDELRFASYPLFSLAKPVPLEPPPARIRSTSRTGTIEVGGIYVLAATASSFLRYGNGEGPHLAESRIVDIRHFNHLRTPADIADGPIPPVQAHRTTGIRRIF